MASNSPHSLYHGDCIDLTSEPLSEATHDNEPISLIDTNTSENQLPDLISSTIKASVSKSSIPVEQDKPASPLQARIISTSNSKLTLQNKHNVVVLSSQIQSAEKNNQSLNMGVSDIILTPSPSDVIRRKFPTNPADEDVIFMSSQQLLPTPTQKLHQALTKPIANRQLKPVANPLLKPVANSLLKPVVKPQLTAVANQQFKPIANPQLKAIINPQFKPVANPHIKPFANQQRKPVINPRPMVNSDPKPAPLSSPTVLNSKLQVPSTIRGDRWLGKTTMSPVKKALISAFPPLKPFSPQATTSASKDERTSQSVPSQFTKPVSASSVTLSQTVSPSLQSKVRKVTHVLPKCLSNDKQLVQDIKLATSCPKLQKLNLSIKSKSKEEVLKAIREASNSTLVTTTKYVQESETKQMSPRRLVQIDPREIMKHGGKKFIGSKKLVLNPFQENKVKDNSYTKTANEAKNCNFSGSEITKTYQKGVPETVYVQSVQEDTVSTNGPMFVQHLGNATATQSNPFVSTPKTQIYGENIQVSTPLTSKSMLNQPPTTASTPISNRLQHSHCIESEDIAMDHEQTFVQKTETQVNSETIQTQKVLNSAFTPSCKINPVANNSAPISSAPRKAVLRNPLNGLVVRSKALQNYNTPKNVLPQDVNLAELAETASAVANINESPDGAKGNQIVFLLYPMDKVTGIATPFKEGQIQQMVALLPSGSGFVQQPVPTKEVEQIGIGDIPLLPLVNTAKQRMDTEVIPLQPEMTESTQEPPPLLGFDTPNDKTPEEADDDVILICDDLEPEDVTKDIEIEPPAVFTPVDIANIINRFKKPAVKSRCDCYLTRRKKKTFKGFNLREKKNPSCLGYMKALAQQIKISAEKQKHKVLLQYPRNIVYCSSNENEFLPELVKTEAQEEVEEFEVLTILDDEDEAESSGFLPTIGDVITQVNREVFALRQKPRSEGEVPPQAIEMIKKGLEMIQHWSQRTGTENELETVIRDKLQEPLVTFNKRRTKKELVSKAPKRRTDNEEKTEPVKKKRGRKPKAALETQAATAPIVKKINVGGKPIVRRRRQKRTKMDDNDDDLLMVKRVDIVKSNGEKKIRGRRKKFLNS